MQKLYSFEHHRMYDFAYRFSSINGHEIWLKGTLPDSR